MIFNLTRGHAEIHNGESHDNFRRLVDSSLRGCGKDSRIRLEASSATSRGMAGIVFIVGNMGYGA